MKQIHLFLFISLIFFLTSCATAIKTGKVIPQYTVSANFNNPKMEYLGFKIDTNLLSTTTSTKVSTGIWEPDIDIVMSEFELAKKVTNTKSLKRLGYNLESDKIASNKSDLYFGIYSLQELELFKSDTKYVTFVEVTENRLNYQDNKGSKNIIGGIGAGLLIGGLPWIPTEAQDFAIGCTVAGGLISLIALTPSKTKVSFNGLYNIYIYDTEEKSIIRKESVNINCNETFVGSYSYDDSSKEIVWDFIAQNVYNELLKRYEELNYWVSSR